MTTTLRDCSVVVYQSAVACYQHHRSSRVCRPRESEKKLQLFASVVSIFKVYVAQSVQINLSICETYSMRNTASMCIFSAQNAMYMSNTCQIILVQSLIVNFDGTLLASS